MNILVSGSLAYDQIMTYPGEFKDHILVNDSSDLNVSFLVDQMSKQFGGTAGNIAYNLGLLGQQSTVIASLGKDYSQYLEWLDTNGIQTAAITINQSTYTATAYISTDINGNQIAFFYPGSMAHPQEIALSALNTTDAFATVSPGNMADMSKLAEHYKKSQIPYIFDPGQQIPALSETDLLAAIKGAFLLICNAYEFEMIKAKTKLSTNDLLKHTNQIIVTQGAEGSLLITESGVIHIEATPVELAIDPTGAGDAYRAGLISGIISGNPIVESAKIGAACASFCVETIGTQNHQFTIEEINERYQK